MKKRVIVFPVIFLFIFAYAYFLEVFFAKYLWLFFGIFIYLVFFIANDSLVKRKEMRERLRIKERKDIRIGFWHCF